MKKKYCSCRLLFWIGWCSLQLCDFKLYVISECSECPFHLKAHTHTIVGATERLTSGEVCRIYQEHDVVVMSAFLGVEHTIFRRVLVFFPLEMELSFWFFWEKRFLIDCRSEEEVVLACCILWIQAHSAIHIYWWLYLCHL